MSRILLLKPYWPYPYGKGEHTYNRIWAPLSLLNCAAILQQSGHQPYILDAHALRIKARKLRPYLQGFEKIVISSSCLDRWQCPNIDITPFLEAVENLKQVTAEFYVTGYHGTRCPEDMLRKTGAKAVIRGEPESVILDIASGKSLQDIPGITYAGHSRIVSNPDACLPDLKTLPVPAYRLLNPRKYFYEILGGRFALLEYSRGCQYQCTFCNKVMYGSGLRLKSARQMIEEIRTVVEECHFRSGYFIDLEFLSDREMVEDICDFFITENYDFRWCCQTRVDSLDGDILMKMKKAGCQLIHFGVESGKQKFLNETRKGFKLDRAMPSVKLCKDAGIKTLAFFIFGFQEETARDRAEILEYAKTLDTDYVSFHKIFPYAQDNGSVPEFRPDEIDAFIRQAFLQYYLRPACLKKLDFNVLLRSVRLLWARMTSLS